MINNLTFLHSVSNYYLRVISILFLYLSCLFWVRILGYGSSVQLLDYGVSDIWYLVFFSCFYPIIGFGLWTTLGWGRALWYFCLFLHLVIYYYFSSFLITYNSVYFLLHFFSVFFYLLLHLRIYLLVRKDR